MLLSSNRLQAKAAEGPWYLTLTYFLDDSFCLDLIRLILLVPLLSVSRL